MQMRDTLIIVKRTGGGGVPALLAVALRRL